MNRSKPLCLLFLALILTPPIRAGGGEDEAISLPIRDWLVLGPVATALPAFSGEADFGAAEMLESEVFDPAELRPAPGDAGPWPADDAAWTVRQADPPGLDFPAGEETLGRAWAAVYLSADRFLTAQLELRSGHLLRVFLDGEEVAKKTEVSEESGSPEPEKKRRKRRGREAASTDGAAGELEAELHLATGQHLLLVEALRAPEAAGSGAPQRWTLAGELSLAAERSGHLGMTVSPRHRLRLADLLEVEAVTAVHVSPDGAHVAIEMRRPAVPADDEEVWIEIRRIADGDEVRVVRGGARSFAWGPGGKHFAYVTGDEKGSTLWWSSLAGGELRALVEEVEGFDDYRVVADGASVVYSRRQRLDDEERGAKRYRGPTDRWSDWRRTIHLYQVAVAGGLPRRLTAGRVSDELQDLHPAGGRALLARTRYGLTEPPFSATDLYELELSTLEPRLLREVGWFDAAAYSPDGRKILVRGGPSIFDGAGENAPAGRSANEYDSQLFIFDPANGEVDPITRDFDPTVLDAVWSRHDGRIYLRVQDESSSHLVRYDPASRAFDTLRSGVEAMAGISVALRAEAVAWYGSSADEPQRVFAWTGGEPQLIAFPGAERWARVELGEVEPWSFTSAEGGEITGRVHYPPDFDPQKKYPLIVYYYGGAGTVGRDFGGRYPKNLWAANGYVVYVLQPSGALGFGQEFSSRHANDWGHRVGREILDGVAAFLDAHPFVDRDRIGCLGGSYGGFMTMYLLTRSDLFAAAVSHAGISNIASYWGDGWWGYLYGAVAAAGSYPWNNPELFVEQSPLFRADEITEPLLLLHGTADVNVPPGESHQIYTALEVLGRDVELIEIAGEGHRIFKYKQRKLWTETILAWFDRYLKGEPEYWEHLWGTDEEPKG